MIDWDNAAVIVGGGAAALTLIVISVIWADMNIQLARIKYGYTYLHKTPISRDQSEVK